MIRVRSLAFLSILLSSSLSHAAAHEPDPTDFWSYTLRGYIEKDAINIAQADVFSARREVVMRQELLNMAKRTRAADAITVEEYAIYEAEYNASLHKLSHADSRLVEAQIVKKVTDLRIAWSNGESTDVATLEALTHEFRKAQCNSINERMLETQALADAAHTRFARAENLNRTNVVAKETVIRANLDWLVIEDRIVADRTSVQQCKADGF